MKESISELQSAIRRVRPHLLLHQSYPSTTTTQSQSLVENSTNDNNNEVAVRNELQLEAASDLINAVATFVWKLDCLWDDHSRIKQEQQQQHNDRMDIENEPEYENDRSISAALTESQLDGPHSE